THARASIAVHSTQTSFAEQTGVSPPQLRASSKVHWTHAPSRAHARPPGQLESHATHSTPSQMGVTPPHAASLEHGVHESPVANHSPAVHSSRSPPEHRVAPGEHTHRPEAASHSGVSPAHGSSCQL